MLDNKIVSTNTLDSSVNWILTQTINKRDLQTETLLFDDGHVEIINQCTPPMTIHLLPTNVHCLVDGEYESVPECMVAYDQGGDL